MGAQSAPGGEATKIDLPWAHAKYFGGTVMHGSILLLLIGTAGWVLYRLMNHPMPNLGLWLAGMLLLLYVLLVSKLGRTRLSLSPRRLHLARSPLPWFYPRSLELEAVNVQRLDLSFYRAASWNTQFGYPAYQLDAIAPDGAKRRIFSRVLDEKLAFEVYGFLFKQLGLCEAQDTLAEAETRAEADSRWLNIYVLVFFLAVALGVPGPTGKLPGFEWRWDSGFWAVFVPLALLLTWPLYLQAGCDQGSTKTQPPQRRKPYAPRFFYIGLAIFTAPLFALLAMELYTLLKGHPIK
jgi:membrane protein implicated in regulation of membrane protease activity